MHMGINGSYPLLGKVCLDTAQQCRCIALTAVLRVSFQGFQEQSVLIRLQPQCTDILLILQPNAVERARPCRILRR